MKKLKTSKRKSSKSGPRSVKAVQIYTKMCISSIEGKTKIGYDINLAPNIANLRIDNKNDKVS